MKNEQKENSILYNRNQKFIPGARLTVWQQEHLTLVAPRVYISNVRQPPQINWAISIPEKFPPTYNNLSGCDKGKKA